MPKKTYQTIYYHFVWSTKGRLQTIPHSLMSDLFKHIKYAYRQGFVIDFVNGTEDHVHCLIASDVNLNPSDIAKQIKGESSRWINKNNLFYEDNYVFRWQRGFAVFSVSMKDVRFIRSYIKNQKQHHEKLQFGEELRVLLKGNLKSKIKSVNTDKKTSI